MTRKKKARTPWKMLVLVSQLGISMLTCIFLCMIAGKILSERLHFDWIFPAFLILGALAGFRSCYHVILRFADLGVGQTEEGTDDDGMDEPGK